MALSTVQKIDRLSVDSDLMHRAVHGGVTETVTTEGGDIPSLANAINTLKAYNVRGEWQSGMLLSMKDVITHNGIAYVVLSPSMYPSTDLIADIAAGRVGVHQGATREELAGAPGSSLIGFQQDGDGAVVQDVQKKLRNSTPVDPRDYGADATGTTDSSSGIYKALKTGRPVRGDWGKFRIAAPIVWDGGEDIDTVLDIGSTCALSLGVVGKDAGNFAAISVCNMRRPDVRLRFSGGGNGSATDVGLQWFNVEGMYLDLTGFSFNGLLAKYDGSQGRWVMNRGGRIHARQCYKSIDASGPAGNNVGTGKLDAVIDELPLVGAVFQNLSDLSLGHYENTIKRANFTASNSLSLIGLASFHADKIALGDQASTMLVVSGGAFLDINDLYVFGGNVDSGAGTSTGVSTFNVAFLNIKRLQAVGLAAGLRIGGNSRTSIGDFETLNNTNDIVFDSSNGVGFGVNTIIKNWDGQGCFAEHVKILGTGLSGKFKVDGGVLRAGNVGTAASAAIDTGTSSGGFQTYVRGLTIDSAYPTSISTLVRDNFHASDNDFAGVVKDTFGQFGSSDGRSWLILLPTLAFATNFANTHNFPFELTVGFQFSTACVATDYVNLTLIDPNGTTRPQQAWSALGSLVTANKLVILTKIVPAGWSYRFDTSNSNNVTFSGAPTAMRI